MLSSACINSQLTFPTDAFLQLHAGRIRRMDIMLVSKHPHICSTLISGGVVYDSPQSSLAHTWMLKKICSFLTLTNILFWVGFCEAGQTVLRT